MDDFSLIAVNAETHPPGYAFHKYWARKPHNVVRLALKACGVTSGSIVIDPFCGSGVPLSEAADLGATCIGFDVNPVAVELTTVTLNPPDPDTFRKAMINILDELEYEFQNLFCINGRSFKYAVHASVVDCGSCKHRVSADTAPKRGRTYICPRCSSRLYFNLENLVATRQLRVVFNDGTELVTEENHADSRGKCLSSQYDHEFYHNGRILAFPGMRTRHLFTPRNFSVLTALAEKIKKLPIEVRSAALLTLTASAAQCSRLIAYRNKLTTGGPAWTVPGFWVPPLHLETNPLSHIRARVSRNYKGFKHLKSLGGRGDKHKIMLGDAGALLAEHQSLGLRASVAFLDPPYGDSVPYLEFSTMWNSFLGGVPDPGLDIAVSNRSRGDGTWEKYEQGLNRTIKAMRGLLAEDGRIIVTFNNKDARAWKALLASLQVFGFRCKGAFYQHPAVVSAKAQLAQEGSYVGDVYSVFILSDDAVTNNTAPVVHAIQRALLSHQDTVLNEEAVQRVAVTEFLRSNIDADILDKLPELIAKARILVENNEATYPNLESFADVTISIASKMLITGQPVPLANIVAELHKHHAHLGILSAPRIKELLGRRFEVRDGQVSLRSELVQHSIPFSLEP